MDDEFTRPCGRGKEGNQVPGDAAARPSEFLHQPRSPAANAENGEQHYEPIASKRFLSPLGGAFPWRGEVLLLTACARFADEIGPHLRAAGFAFRVSEPARSTLRHVLLRPPVLLVVDMAKDAELGLELGRDLADALGPVAPRTMAICSGDDETAFERAFNAGACDALARPIAPSLLRVKAALHARAQSDLPPRIGGYRIVRLLGRGGMGTVYLAERHGTEVALKVLDTGAGPAEPETLARFKREANALRTLRGKGIPRFLDAGRVDDCFFCVMEYVPGETLMDALDRGPLAEGRVALVVDQVAEALETIHATGLVHRDVKPQNVILLPEGGAKLVDFGLAKFKLDPAITRADELIGTIHYMAPELVRGDPATPASDAFSLGMSALEALLGTCPAPGPVDQAAARLARNEVPRPSALVPSAPPALLGVLDGLLAPLAAQRLSLADARAALFPLGTGAQAS